MHSVTYQDNLLRDASVFHCKKNQLKDSAKSAVVDIKNKRVTWHSGMEQLLGSEEANHLDGGSELSLLSKPLFPASPLGSQKGHPIPGRRLQLPMVEVNRCVCTGTQGELPCTECDSAWGPHLSTERASPGKMKRKNPQLELLETKAGTEDDTGSGCCVACESQAGSNPCHSRSPHQAKRSSKAANPLWRSKALASTNSSTAPVNAGNPTVSPMALADSPETEHTMSILNLRKGVNCCSEPR